MRLTIGKKLNGLIVTLQLLSIGGVVVLATQLFTSDLEGLLRKGTLDVSAMLAGRVRAEMSHVADRARMLGAASLENFEYEADRLRFIQENVALDPQYIGMGVYRRSLVGKQERFTPVWRIAHPEVMKRLKFNQKDFEALDSQFPLNFKAVAKGDVDFTVARMKDGTPSLRMAIPFVQRRPGEFSQLIAIELNQERLTRLFADSTAYTSYLVDRSGNILGSTDPKRLPLGQNVRDWGIFQAIQSASGFGGQTDFKDPSGEIQMGAFQKVGFADLTVVTQAPLSRALQAQKQLYRRTASLAGAFLCLALFLGFLFSQSITGPVKALAAAAASVATGDFSVRLKTKGHQDSGDEIQQFSSTFNEMVGGLEERDRVKATFAKFHSKEVADKLMSGEVNLGGERKSAAVFFSDVRGFTALSEGMDPEALVSILNRYMTRMVRVILQNGGIVDKYVGDAIMAVWGVPVSKEGDCERAIMACLGMRQALAEFNEELKAEGLPLLKIGMGLNFGTLISGNIGSEERMEYTVIGDTVNTASRIESLTKEFGTDLLISQAVLDQVPGKFIVERTHEAKVKGKSEPLVIYKVHGLVDEFGNQVLIQTPYSSYAAERSDKVVHDDAPAKPAAQSASALKLVPPTPPPWPPRSVRDTAGPASPAGPIGGNDLTGEFTMNLELLPTESAPEGKPEGVSESVGDSAAQSESVGEMAPSAPKVIATAQTSSEIELPTLEVKLEEAS